jgi:competence ComEA-like helix-hairpin-helix protein
MSAESVRKAGAIARLIIAGLISAVMVIIVVIAVCQSTQKTYLFAPGKASALPAVTDPVKSGLNINTASKNELMELPGISETTARAILDSREKDGLFHYIEDLLSVKGIGEKTLADIRSLIYVL